MGISAIGRKSCTRVRLIFGASRDAPARDEVAATRVMRRASDYPKSSAMGVKIQPTAMKVMRFRVASAINVNTALIRALMRSGPKGRRQ